MTAIEYENIMLLKECSTDKSSDNEFVNDLARDIHFRVILDFIYTYLVERNIKSPLLFFRKCFIYHNYEPHYVVEFRNRNILEECERLHTAFLNSTFKINQGHIVRSLSKDNIISEGKVYTQKNVADDIVSRTMSNVLITHNTHSLDFACGTGRFYDSLAKNYESAGIDREYSILHCIDAIDIDPVAINITRLKACDRISTLSIKNAVLITQRIQWKNALIPGQIEELCLFNNETLYDVIVSNPPYLVLKPSHKTSTKLALDIKKQVKYYQTSGLYNFSLEGMLNLYQLSIERMISLLKPYGELGVICPSTLFADKSATKLRKFLLQHNKVRQVIYFPEKTILFENNVTQATSIFTLQKAGQTDSISVSYKGESFVIDIQRLKGLFAENLEIPLISGQDWKVLMHLAKFPKLKSYSYIRNRRGELDLTLNGKYISQERTSLRLIRGKMITEKGIQSKGAEFVSEEFLKTKSNDFIQNDFGKIRLVGQNISNVDNLWRLRFNFCEPNDILGNSCNYLSAELPILKKLHILLSSRLLNWRFKITSSNNHINNYELAELPIVDLNRIDEELVFNTQSELDSYVEFLYGFKEKELDNIFQ